MLLLAKHRPFYVETYSLLATSPGDIRGNPRKVLWTQVRLILCVTSGPAKEHLLNVHYILGTTPRIIPLFSSYPRKPELIILFLYIRKQKHKESKQCRLHEMTHSSRQAISYNVDVPYQPAVLTADFLTICHFPCQNEYFLRPAP